MEEIVIKDGVHFIGKPCVKCGSRVRYVCNNNCVKCQRLIKHNHYMRNQQSEIERIKQWKIDNDYDRKYRECNKSRIRENQKRWEQRNPDKIKKSREKSKHRTEISRRKWYTENRDVCLERSSNWKKNNRKQVNITNRLRKNKKRANGGSFTYSEWVELCNLYANRCIHCQESLPLEIDHIIPISKGGTNYIWNIQPLCKSCNLTKHAKIIDYRPKENIPQEYIDFLASLE